MDIEQKLKMLFDFQKLEKNPKLSRLISETENDGVELTDEELSFVNAAGETDGRRDTNQIR